MRKVLCILFILSSSIVFANEDNISFAILNVREAKEIVENPRQCLKNSLLSYEKGLYIHLVLDHSGELALELPQQNTFKWDSFIKLAYDLKLKKHLQTSPLVINTDAISLDFFFSKLEKIEKEKSIVIGKVDTEVLSNSFENGKLIFILESQQKISPFSWLVSMDNFITKTSVYNNQVKYIWIDEAPQIESRNDNLTMLLPIMIEWKKHAKFPLFVSTDNPFLRYNTTYQALKTTNCIVGEIASEDSSLNTIFWRGDEFQMSSIYFNFPLDDEMRLEPSAPGYSFFPSVITVSDKKQNAKFTARRIALYSNLNAHYCFGNDELEQTRKSPIKNIFGTEIIKDASRGDVLSMSRGDFLELPSVNHFNFKNNSFTIAVWAKYIRDMKDDYSPIICSSQTTYRKGLQVAIREGKAYAGFWHADIYGKTNIQEKEWTHIVCRYDHVAQRMSIFINGKEDVTVTPYYPFLGEGKLFVGRVSGHNYGFEGMLDDIMIWERAISDDDILRVYSADFHQVPVSNIKLLVFVSALIVLLCLTILYVSKVNKQREKQRILRQKGKKNQYKYRIYLVGGFQIIDKHGKDVAKALSPRLKSMFILILLYSIREGGICPSQLREELWEDYPKKKGQNAQRVTLNRLKKALSSIEEINVDTRLEKWFIDFSPNTVWVDFKNLWEIWTNKPEDHIIELLSLLKRGMFIQEFEEPWADKQKGIFSNRYYDFLISVLENKEVKIELRKNVADIVVIDEPLNEEALQVKVQYYTEKGRSHMAKQEYDAFCKHYRRLYNEDFKVSFIELLGKEEDK